MATTLDKRRDDIVGNMDTSFLKVLALVFMLIDHMGVVIFPTVPELRVIGRMAFPLYAWCLVVGSIKTSDPLRYGMRLIALAVISQPLYMMALNHTWTDLSVLFTLTVGLAALTGVRVKWMGSQFWAPLLCYVLLGYLKMDYGWRGLTFMLMLYAARNSRSALVAVYIAFAMFWGNTSSSITHLFGYELTFLNWKGIGAVLTPLFRLQGMIWLSLPLIAFNTHSNLRMPHWLGYGLYPLHLILLILLRLLAKGVLFETLVAGF